MGSSQYKATKVKRYTGPAAPESQVLSRNIPNDRSWLDTTVPYDREITNQIIEGKVLPIILCLDVSPSMGKHNRIQQQNEAIMRFIRALCEHSKARTAVRIAFCLFTDEIVYPADLSGLKFMKLDELTFPLCPYLETTQLYIHPYSEDRQTKEFRVSVPVFRASQEQVGTHIPVAVEKSVEIMKAYLSTKEKGQRYPAFMVFTSDGNPDFSHYSADIRANYELYTDRAARMIESVCDPRLDVKDLVVPFFVGVGDAKADYLRRFSKHFPEGVLMVNGANDRLAFEAIFKPIAQCIAQSMNMSGSTCDLLEKLCEYIEAVLSV